ncbi:hypothetical protein [Pseudonocardia acaciae]|uniref:hypothetical protein n=1 Tax=Pseudonocardia acaciae TaxID=551276 RepID=UPI000491E945|nr:hypothetical protein [Pseudonocardia acaciae]
MARRHASATPSQPAQRLGFEREVGGRRAVPRHARRDGVIGEDAGPYHPDQPTADLWRDSASATACQRAQTWSPPARRSKYTDATGPVPAYRSRAPVTAIYGWHDHGPLSTGTASPG